MSLKGSRRQVHQVEEPVRSNRFEFFGHGFDILRDFHVLAIDEVYLRLALLPAVLFVSYDPLWIDEESALVKLSESHSVSSMKDAIK
jgi:hypothetical protein